MITAAQICLVIIFAALIADGLLLFGVKQGLTGKRQLSDRLSNGDNNTVQIILNNLYTFEVYCLIYEELPFQFQKRDFVLITDIASNGQLIKTT